MVNKIKLSISQNVEIIRYNLIKFLKSSVIKVYSICVEIGKINKDVVTK